MRIILKIFPWLIIILLGIWAYITYKSDQNVETVINRSAILQEIETLGKLELVKYNFKEITEVTEVSKEYFRFFKLGPDSKIALISEGQAVGCIDLTKIRESDLVLENDTLYVKLPSPEICYYKLDMEKTRIYSLQTNPMKDEKKFIQKAYKHAEREIKASALNSGILEQTRENAETILKPLLEQISGHKVILTTRIEEVEIDLN
ncbi:hypothetical protein GCM10009122_21810 [Fulvivirga kasyanovii]|uniref:DUF4230 domain-containing protein n=1 Tax=Fulvivirga kasyanovii TaxID=396812 RepID=A0ABW9RW98_9BACT|nr:DUF4230 domain-containing protein [Fulvivirga kasyanovii]MTI28514.1 DUF4230 domain-containing protein [Fulvivirga kasyanovii]